jgi:hypothetical protein
VGEAPVRTWRNAVIGAGAGFGGTADAWSPRNIASLISWYVADTDSDITYGTGSNVARWDPRAGSGYLSQSTEAEQPTFDTDGVLFATAETDNIRLTFDANIDQTDCTAYAVITKDVTSTTGYQLALGRVPVTVPPYEPGLYADISGSTNNAGVFYNVGFDCAVYLSPSAKHIMRCHITAAEVGLSIDGAAAVIGAAPLNIGDWTGVSNVGVASQSLCGTVHELIFCSDALPPEDADIVAYLKEKWGIA